MLIKLALLIAERDVSKRTAKVSGLLKPLRPGMKIACSRVRALQATNCTIAAHDGTVSSATHRDLFFRTFVPSIKAQYFEVWAFSGDKDGLGLRQAYLHLIQKGVNPNDQIEVLALHSDPVDEHLYKRGPHIHVKCAGPPISKCHFALDLGNLINVTSNLVDFDLALSRSIQMLADEVLSAYFEGERGAV